MTPVIGILIADDHAVMRSGLRLLLDSQSDMHVVAECGNHREVLDTLARLGDRVGIVTLDLTMPGGSPAALIEDVVRSHPGTHVVVLTMHDDPSYARLALTAGAGGYVVKSAADTELLKAIRTVANGGMYSTVSMATRPRTTAEPPLPDGRPAVDSLSEREREVLLLVARGYTNKQIADQLLLSVKTVESYRARLMSKLSLKDRSELTRFVLETGLVGRLQKP